MKKFLKTTKAATAIEFAIIAPVFFLLLIGIIEFGLTMFFQSCLNMAIRDHARYYQTHQYGTGADDGTHSFVDSLLNQSGGVMDPGKVRQFANHFSALDDPKFLTSSYMLQTTGPETMPEFQALGPNAPAFAEICTDPATNKPCAQGNKIALFGVSYEWGGITKLLSPFIPKRLYAFTVVRNEEF